MLGCIRQYADVGVLYYSPQAGGRELDNPATRGCGWVRGMGVGGVKGCKTTGVAENANVRMSICVARRPSAAGIEKHLLLM